MTVRIAWILLAAAVSMTPASAADLGGQMSATECDCGASNMITVYDSQPGVVTRRWWADCACESAPAARRPLRVVAPYQHREYESLIEPWRR